MHECTSIIINSFHLFRRTLFNKGFVVEEVGGSLKSEWKQTGGGEGSSLSLCLLCKKTARFFKQQIEFLLISCLTVPGTSQFFIQKFISILHVKWTGMNKGEQVENLKFWVNILFEWSQNLFNATKIYILTFNLTHFLISLMGSFYFPQWKIIFLIHW